jgi:hypothetical protein
VPVPLIVILGAGASRGSGDYGTRLRPPLTLELFDATLYRDVLAAYELAHQAGRFITQELAGDEALALEKALHALRISDFPHHRHMALAVPPYLQQLLYAVSDAHHTSAFRYDRLIERLLRLPYAMFMTLNYDVLLDRRLHAHHSLSGFGDYIRRDKNWSLIKLHGSVNWHHPIAGSYPPSRPPSDLAWDTATFGCEAPDASLSAIRNLGSGHTSRYPALALPEGPEDRLVLPPSHREFVKGMLRANQEIDLLVIGYSGLDTEVLRLLRNGGCSVRRMTVVNKDVGAAAGVLDVFKAAGIDPVWPNVVDGDFASWTDSGGLTQLVDEYDGPYE